MPQARQVENAPVHHLGPTLSGYPVWHLAVDRRRDVREEGDGGRKEDRREKRRKKGEGESGTQEAVETGCGQLFTSWRMIHVDVVASLRNLCVYVSYVSYVDLRGPLKKVYIESTSILTSFLVSFFFLS